MHIYFRFHLEWLYLLSCVPQRKILSLSSFTISSPPKMGFEGQKETLSRLIFVLHTRRFWHQVQNLCIRQNLKCGKATAHTSAELSGTKSCGFSEEKTDQKRYSSTLRCFSVWESSCFQEVNVKGSLVPLGKGQLLYSKKTPHKIRMQRLLLHSSLALCLWLERLLSLKHRNRQITTFNFCLDKNSMSEKAGVKTETATGEVCM